MVIESQTELDEFVANHRDDEIILVPILCDDCRHELNNELCFLLIKIIGKHGLYIFPISHNECINLPKESLSKLNIIKKYTHDKKKLLNIFPFDNVIDAKLLKYLMANAVEDFMPTYSVSHNEITKRYNSIRNVNKSIPILKYQEELSPYIDKIENLILQNKQALDEECFLPLNNTKIECLQKIEFNGLKVDESIVLKYFPNSKKHVSNGIIHTQYNMYTVTGRPSNRFGNINYAALKYETGERQVFVSRFDEDGILIMYDFEAYHLRLIADMINYEFPENISAHEFLGRQYFNKPQLTDEEYEESKKISFNVLYGGISKEISQEIPFFHSVQEFIDQLWHKFNTDGYVQTLIYKQKFKRENFTDMNANKLFNFILQNIETERNIGIIKLMQEFLQPYQSKLVLYLYDAMLFDVLKNEESTVIPRLKNIMESGGKYPARKYIGKNFQDMVKVK